MVIPYGWLMEIVVTAVSGNGYWSEENEELTMGNIVKTMNDGKMQNTSGNVKRAGT
jgi:hypothetical protein